MRPPRVLLGTLLRFMAVRLLFSCFSNEASKRLYVVAFISDLYCFSSICLQISGSQLVGHRPKMNHTLLFEF